MPLDFDALNKKKNQRLGQGWTPDPGDNEVRVLPPTSDYFTELIGFIGYEFRNHFISLEGQDLEVFRCLRDDDQKCPACQFYYGHRNDNDPGVSKIADKFNPSRRFVMNIIDLSDPSAGIQSYQCGPSVHNEILKFVANENWGDCLDPEEGRNFTITLTPGNQNPTGYNQYDVMPAPNPSSVVHHLPEGWKDALDALQSDVPEIPSREQVESVVNSGKEQAFGDSRTGNPASDTSEPASDSTPTPKADQDSGFSPEVSEPVDQDTTEPTSEPGTTPEASTDSGGVLPPRVEGGPNIDPETDQPVCFGEFDREQYPCDVCDVERDCAMQKLDL